MLKYPDLKLDLTQLLIYFGALFTVFLAQSAGENTHYLYLVSILHTFTNISKQVCSIIVYR